MYVIQLVNHLHFAFVKIERLFLVCHQLKKLYKCFQVAFLEVPLKWTKYIRSCNLKSNLCQWTDRWPNRSSLLFISVNLWFILLHLAYEKGCRLSFTFIIWIRRTVFYFWRMSIDLCQGSKSLEINEKSIQLKVIEHCLVVNAPHMLWHLFISACDLQIS